MMNMVTSSMYQVKSTFNHSVDVSIHGKNVPSSFTQVNMKDPFSTSTKKLATSNTRVESSSHQDCRELDQGRIFISLLLKNQQRDVNGNLLILIIQTRKLISLVTVTLVKIRFSQGHFLFLYC